MKVPYIASNLLALLGSLANMRPHPSIASSVIPVSLFNAALALPLLVAASRPKTPASVFHELYSASSFLSTSASSATPDAVVSTVPPTSDTSYVSSRSSSSELNAASADRIAAFVGPEDRSRSRVSAVKLSFLRPMCRREVSTVRLSSSSLSKTLRRFGGDGGGVGRGAR